MFLRTINLLGAGFLLAWPAVAAEPPSSGWRGDGTGRFPDATPPLEWDGDTGKNILWRTKVGVSKFSSPVFVPGKVFVTAEPARLICVDAENGKILWEQANGFADVPVKPPDKPARSDQGNTTPTPVSDGRFVYAAFGSGIVACYELQGARQWMQFLDVQPGLEYGRSCSPVLCGDKLLVSVHHLFALDVKSGQVLWKNEMVAERYGTPVIARAGGMELALMPSGQIVKTSDGTVLSTATELQYASPLVHGPSAYFIGTIASAVTLPEAGGDAAIKTAWKTELEGSFFASPVFDNGLLFTASNEGNFLVLDPADGKTILTKELEIGSGGGRPDRPNANIYPSVTLAGNHLFVSNDNGDTLVLEPGREYKEIKHNNLGEGFSGTPVFAGKRMYVRTKDRLYCVGAE